MSPSPSRKLLIIVVVAVIVAGIPIFLLPRRPKVSDDKVTRMAIASMTSDLRGLILAEETTKRIRGHYEVDAASAGHLSSPGVTTPVIVVADTGWSATVGFKTIPELKCAVAVYKTNPLKRFAKSGEVVCE
jgi:hypothetical protein